MIPFDISFYSTNRLEFAVLVRLAASSSHLELTENAGRSEVSVLATVTNLWQESKAVKGLSLSIENSSFTFKSGQW